MASATTSRSLARRVANPLDAALPPRAEPKPDEPKPDEMPEPVREPEPAPSEDADGVAGPVRRHVRCCSGISSRNRDGGLYAGWPQALRMLAASGTAARGRA